MREGRISCELSGGKRYDSLSPVLRGEGGGEGRAMRRDEKRGCSASLESSLPFACTRTEPLSPIPGVPGRGSKSRVRAVACRDDERRRSGHARIRRVGELAADGGD